MNKNETKYQFTARLMDEALLRLLEDKDFDFITVKELCNKAGVNRSTFYLHYETMIDLLDETIEYVNDKFFSEMKPEGEINLTEEVLTREKFLKPYLLFIKNNLNIYKLVHSHDNLFKSKKTFEMLYNNIFSKALDNFKVKNNEKKYILAFYTNGTIAVVKRWIEDDCKDDIDFIIDIIERHTGN